MNNFLILIISIVITCFSAIDCFAQENFSQKEGRITQYEMDMKEYEKDKEAEAVVIYEKGENYFYPDDMRGFVLYMRSSMKIKVLKQAGIEYADFEIPYYEGDEMGENVLDIKGVTYNVENGALQKTELSSASVFDEKSSNGYRIKKFTMPNVREGSVIEVSYTHTSIYFHRMKEWKFQRKIPVVSSVLAFRAIPYYEYTYIVKGASKFDIFSSEEGISTTTFGRLKYREITYNFGMQNLPAFKDETFITSPRDYMVSLNLQLSKIHYPTGGGKEIMTTWELMLKDFLKHPSLGKYVSQSQKEAKKILPTLGIEGKTDREKTKIIADYVKSLYKWDSSYGKYAYSEKLSTFLKKTTGNAGDINLFLAGLLKGAGLDANPVVLSTRENGMISRNHPFESFLNYVITEVNINGEKVFIDATEPLLHYDELPSRCTNVEGLVVKPNAEEWVFVVQRTLATTNTNLNISIDPKTMTANVQTEYTTFGNDAFHYRKVYERDDRDLKNYLKKTYNVNVEENVAVRNFENRDEPFIFDFKFKTPIEGTPEKIFIKPFLSFSLEQNPFTQTSRTLPLDFIFYGGNSYQAVIDIPEGYVIEHLPNTTKPNTPLLDLTYSTKVVGNQIIVNASYTRKSNIYPADSYTFLKNLYTMMIDRFSEMIVLVPKE